MINAKVPTYLAKAIESKQLYRAVGVSVVPVDVHARPHLAHVLHDIPAQMYVLRLHVARPCVAEHVASTDA